MLNLDLDNQYVEFIKETINSVLDGVEIYIFGSRTQGKSLEYSDVDIALKGKTQIEFDKILNLRVAFSNSTFPYKVDIIDLNNIDEKFYNIIKDDLYKIL